MGWSDSAKIPEILLVLIHKFRLLFFLITFGACLLFGVASMPTLVPLDELCQIGRLPRSSQKRVLEKVSCRGTFAWITLHALCNKVLERGAEVALQAWRWILGDQKQHLHRMNVRHGRLAGGQLNRSYAQRPDICLVIVTGLFDDLGCHPKRGADKGILLCHCGSQL